MAKTMPSTPAVVEGRRSKAEQFSRAAADTRDSDTTDAYITLLISSGIAASDVICSKRLGYHSTSENHSDAVKTLAQVNKEASKSLKVLLEVKSKSAYTALSSSTTERVKVERAASKLLDFMRSL